MDELYKKVADFRKMGAKSMKRWISEKVRAPRTELEAYMRALVALIEDSVEKVDLSGNHAVRDLPSFLVDPLSSAKRCKKLMCVACDRLTAC